MNFKTLLFTASIALLLSPFAQAKVYTWVDEKGQKHFSDKPPKGETVEEVKNLPTKKHTPSSSSQKELDEYRSQIKSDAERLEEAKAKAEKEEATRKMDAEVCESAKKRMDKLKTFNRIRMEKEDGQLHYLTPDEKQAEVDKTQEQIDTFCR